ncbi:MAG: hypothetical protein ACKOBT_06280, partial [Actinomycetota bacterium]
MDTVVYPSIDWLSISPLVVLLGGMMIGLVAGALTKAWPRALYGSLTATLSVAALVMTILVWRDIDSDGARTIINDALAIDHFTAFCWIGITVALALVSLATSDYLCREDTDGPEIYALYVSAA